MPNRCRGRCWRRGIRWGMKPAWKPGGRWWGLWAGFRRGRWRVLEAGHPLVDESSLEAGRKLLVFVDRIPQEASVLVLISGGASALVEALPPQIGLDRFQEINRWVLGSGLDINDYNRIRRRLSRIKGGRLAKLLSPRRGLCLGVSGVPGNDLRAIGSGPLGAGRGGRRP